ncbi:MAG: DMT family transporter [Archangium sp.]
MRHDGIFRGVLLALSAAVAFGATVPLQRWAGAGLGAFTIAALLYAGALLAAAVSSLIARDAGAPLNRSAIAPLLLMGVFGAALAPSLFAWGVLHVDAPVAALLLNFEMAWTAVLAFFIFRETLGRRAVLGLLAMATGGAVLAVPSVDSHVSLTGVAAIVGATVAWAIDNVASRRLAEHRPLIVVASKSAIGASVSATLALLFSEQRVAAWQFVVLLAAGATGYGLSLRLYLLAQRSLGATRTASVFSLAPFIGAVLGLVAGQGAWGWPLLGAGVLFALGAWLHATERHGHRHHHTALEHEHAHRHDDGHHFHHHDSVIVGEHTHAHRHEPHEHEHEHGPDLHHSHH